MKILIVDDESPARERLQQMLSETDEHTVVGDASNGKDALSAAARLSPDVVLLDIRMPGMSGIETAHHLNDLDNPPAIVFTTAYDQYAIDAFDAQAIGYVLKPVRRERLAKALSHAARLTAKTLDTVSSASGLDEPRTHLCARIQGELKLIAVNDISYFVADQKYTRVCHSEGQNLIDDSLKQLEEEFGALFVRIHRSALVATAQIDSLARTEDGETLVKLRGAMPDGPLKVSRRHVATVRKKLRGEST
ncbi:MAG: LytTR family DNA-binding domain-containing protein [Pseudomonadota bacterium]